MKAKDIKKAIENPTLGVSITYALAAEKRCKKSWEEKCWTKDVFLKWLTGIQGSLGPIAGSAALALVERAGIGPYFVNVLLVDVPFQDSATTHKTLCGIGHLIRSGYLKGDGFGFKWSDDTREAFFTANPVPDDFDPEEQSTLTPPQVAVEEPGGGFTLG